MMVLTFFQCPNHWINTQESVRSSEFIDAKCSAQCTKNLQPRTLYKNSAATYIVQYRQPGMFGPEVDTEKVAGTVSGWYTRAASEA